MMEIVKISVVATNKPTIKKFEADRFLVRQGSFEFKNIDEAKNSPLARELFYLPFVKTVYISQNFVAIERYDIVEWIDVQNEVADQIQNFINSGSPLVLEEKTPKKQPITVYAESTPNPAVMKFVVNKKVSPVSVEFKNIDEAQDAPLAISLFHFPFVKEVFMDDNYISIQKYEMVSWDEIFQEIRAFIKEYIETGKPILNEDFQKTPAAIEKETQEIFDNYDDTSKEIINIIEEYVKPAVAGDGGNILFKNYNPETKNVDVVLQGACSGCPSSTFTLKSGIENMLKEMLPNKINHVNAING